MAACRNMDNDRHENSLNRIKATLSQLLKQQDEDVEKRRRLDIIAEQRKQEVEQLEELTRRLQTNFNAYRMKIDTAVEDLRSAAGQNDSVVQQKIEEMKKVTGQMKWLMNVETVVNGRRPPSQPEGKRPPSGHEPSRKSDEQSLNAVKSIQAESALPPSPSKTKMSLDFRRHRRKGSSKAAK